MNLQCYSFRHKAANDGSMKRPQQLTKASLHTPYLEQEMVQNSIATEL